MVRCIIYSSRRAYISVFIVFPYFPIESSLRLWYASTSIHGVRTDKTTVWIFTSMKTWNHLQNIRITLKLSARMPEMPCSEWTNETAGTAFQCVNTCVLLLARLHTCGATWRSASTRDFAPMVASTRGRFEATPTPQLLSACVTAWWVQEPEPWVLSMEVCDDGILVELLRFWSLPIVLFFYLEHKTFRRLDSVSVSFNQPIIWHLYIYIYVDLLTEPLISRFHNSLILLL
jgi:hypothetical protein